MQDIAKLDFQYSYILLEQQTDKLVLCHIAASIQMSSVSYLHESRI